MNYEADLLAEKEAVAKARDKFKTSSSWIFLAKYILWIRNRSHTTSDQCCLWLWRCKHRIITQHVLEDSDRWSEKHKKFLYRIHSPELQAIVQVVRANDGVMRNFTASEKLCCTFSTANENKNKSFDWSYPHQQLASLCSVSRHRSRSWMR